MTHHEDDHGEPEVSEFAREWARGAAIQGEAIENALNTQLGVVLAVLEEAFPKEYERVMNRNGSKPEEEDDAEAEEA